MIHDLKPLVSARIIGTGNVDELLELAVGVISQELKRRYKRRGCNIERELIPDYRDLLNEFREAGEEVRAIGVQVGCHVFVPCL